MKTPKLTKPGIYGAIVGAALLAINGFSWGGWVTGAKAEEMASDAVVAALVPICIARSRHDPRFTEEIRRLKNAQLYMQQDMVSEIGWATMPGSSKPNDLVASACGKQLVALY